MFNELYYYMRGTTKDGERILSLDEISVDQAKRIQDRLKNQEWEILGGRKAEDVEDLRRVFDDVV